jgi:hypothetical protein
MRSRSGHAYVRSVKITTPAALALTAVALVAASSTAGYAGARFGSADIRDGSLTSIDIKNGSISLGDLSPGTVRAINVGRAYAFVVPQYTDAGDPLPPKLDKTHTYGFSKVRVAQDDGEDVTGIYCLKPSAGVDLSHSPILTSIDYSFSGGTAYRALWASDEATSACTGNEVEVHTYVDAGPTTDPDEPSLSGRAAFQVFAP